MRIPPLSYELHSIADAASAITQGENPWYALGSFLHDWWCAHGAVRERLIEEAPSLPPEDKHWSALCAAIVEEVCRRTALPCPPWTERTDFFLKEPWWYFPQSSQREWLQATTPEPFRRRNVFVGGSVLDNKYELQHLYGPTLKWRVWTDEELQVYRTHAVEDV